MEAFFDPETNRPVEQVEVLQGATKVLGLKKFNRNDVAVRTGDYTIAFCDKVIHLKDKTKRSYDKKSNQHEVAADTEPVEVNGNLFFQVCGNGTGTTELTALFTSTKDNVSYAKPVTIKVKQNQKRLILSASFDTLWANHPLNDKNRKLYENPDHPCPKSTWLVGQCMIRFSTALDKSGVDTTGLSVNKCGLPGKEHQRHYVNPYDFEKWKGLKDAYIWEVKPPLQPEPMPGIAAYYFTMSKRGVILFRDYFPTTKLKTDMAGGHIDLWNRDQMGNTFGNPNQGLSAFVRSRRIVFWPLE